MFNKQTSEFSGVRQTITESELSPEFTIKPDRVFYKIDDFTITQDTLSTDETEEDIEKSVKTLKDIWGKKLPIFISKISDRVFREVQDLPIITYQKYLKEMKDYIAYSNAVPTKRVSLKFDNSLRYDSIIIINKYKDHYALMVEVYENDKFRAVYEYDFNKWMAKYEELSKE